jgi:hypothetical protein
MVTRLFSRYAEIMREKGTDFGCPVAASVIDASAASSQVRSAAREAFGLWRDSLAPRGPDATSLGDTDSLIIAALEGAILMARAEGDADVLERVGSSLGNLLRRAE